MTESPLLSIIIVAYKSGAEIGPCLASLPRQINGGTVEIFVVDNSVGEDAVGEIVRQRFPWATYVAPQTNLGFGRANNLGYASARGEFVLFLNPDTVCNDTALGH
jgi:GT2 family glycosyltransferase